MKGKEVNVASAGNLRSLAGKGREDVRIAAMKEVDLQENLFKVG